MVRKMKDFDIYLDSSGKVEFALARTDTQGRHGRWYPYKYDRSIGHKVMVQGLSYEALRSAVRKGYMELL